MADQLLFILKVALVNFIGGLIYGFHIGFVPIYLYYNDVNTNCTKMTSEAACTHLSFVTCRWAPPHGNASLSMECQFPEPLPCDLLNYDQCSNIDYCYNDYDLDRCLHKVGWDPTQTGVFAGAMLLGAMIGSFFVVYLMTKFGRRKSLMVAGIVGVIGSVLVSVGRAVDVYVVVIAGRVICGATCGIGCVVAPAYVNEMSPEQFKSRLGCVFQVAVTFGICVAAATGLAICPFSFDSELNMEVRFHIFVNIATLLAVACLAIGYLVPESTAWLELVPTDIIASDTTHESSQFTWISLWFQLLSATVLSAAIQLTGICAIMNYAPRIMKVTGFHPLVGNFLVMLWNWISSIASIPISNTSSSNKKEDLSATLKGQNVNRLRSMFIVATTIVGASCLACGITVFPSLVRQETLKIVLVGLSIFVFIGAHMIGMGPPYYVLAQEVFPQSFRGKGASFTMVAQFIFNILVNVGFPIAQETFSGGEDGNQDKGLAICFFIFGGIGLSTVVFNMKFLQPWKEPQDESPTSEIELNEL